MRGNLRQSSLADLLRHVYAERKSGILRLTREGMGRRVHCKKGVPIYADGDDTPFPSRERAESLLHSLFAWTSGEFSFEELDPEVDEARALTASASVVILEGSRRIDDREALQLRLGGEESVFACAQSSVLPLFTLKLTPLESAILKFARERGRFKARELPPPLKGLEAARALNVLASVGLLEVVEKKEAPPRPAALSPAPPARATGRSTFEGLPVVEADAQPALSPPAPAPPPGDLRKAEIRARTSETKRPTFEALPVIEAESQPAREPFPAPPPPTEPPPDLSQVEILLETFAAKRSPSLVDAGAPPSPEPASAPRRRDRDEVGSLLEGARAKPAAAVVSPKTEVEAPLAPDPSPPPAAPPVPAARHRVEVEITRDTLAAKRAAVETPPAAQRAPEASPAPAASRPQGKMRRKLSKATAVAAAVLAIAVLALALSLRSPRGEAPGPDAMVSANASATEPQPEPAATAPPPTPEPPPETPAEPSDAELFFSANLAFENGDYERSKSELETLLARQPNFSAARELLSRVERELAPKPRAAEPAREERRAVEKPKNPEPNREPPPTAPAPPDPAKLFEGARSAFARSDLETAEAQLEALEAVSPSYPGAWKLREELTLRLWERKLPLAFGVRHDHALGSCTGVLQLTSRGFSYRSKEHEWVWSFEDVAETERRSPRRLRIETTKGTSYNFELNEPPSDEDWARHQSLRSR